MRHWLLDAPLSRGMTFSLSPLSLLRQRLGIVLGKIVGHVEFARRQIVAAPPAADHLQLAVTTRWLEFAGEADHDVAAVGPAFAQRFVIVGDAFPEPGIDVEVRLLHL